MEIILAHCIAPDGRLYRLDSWMDSRRFFRMLTDNLDTLLNRTAGRSDEKERLQ